MYNFFFRRYLPGFRVNPQDDVPGFNVDPQDDAPGFNVDENGGLQQETTWSDGLPPGSTTPQYPNTAQTAPPLPDVVDPTPPTPPLLPEWLYQLGTMLPPRLPTTFDPRTGPSIEINAPPRAASSEPWSPSNVPRTAGGCTGPLPQSQQAEHQSPTAERERAVEHLGLSYPRTARCMPQVPDFKVH